MSAYRKKAKVEEYPVMFKISDHEYEHVKNGHGGYQFAAAMAFLGMLISCAVASHSYSEAANAKECLWARPVFVLAAVAFVFFSVVCYRGRRLMQRYWMQEQLDQATDPVAYEKKHKAENSR